MSHPSARELETAVFGWMPEREAADIRSHAAGCPTCGPLLRGEDSVRRRLRLLRGHEPRVDVSERVLQRLDQRSGRRRLPRAARALAVAVAVVAASLLLSSNGNVRRTVQRLGGFVSIYAR